MNKLLLSMARQIHRRLVAHSRSDSALDLLGDVREAQRQFNTARKRLTITRLYRWHEATRLVRQEMFEKARTLNEQLSQMLAQEAMSRPPLPSLWLIIEELKQLHDEFEDVQLCMNQHGLRRVKAVTEPITLEEVELGRFSIELDLHRLSTRCTSACFDCKALDPNYASSNSDVTHPHVSGDALCAGEATLPISNALSQGRICDAFCLVRSVLTTYNPASPYVALQDWNGASCGDCGRSVDSDYLSHCDHCDNSYCDNCMSCCDVCQENACHGCLDRDNKSHQDCCPNCRQVCSKCGRVVNRDDFDNETELCPQCSQPDKETHEQQPDQDINRNGIVILDIPGCDPPAGQAEELLPAAPEPTDTDLQPAGVAEAPVLPARRRHRNRRVRRQQRR